MRKEIEKHLFRPLVLMLVCGTVALLTAVAQTPKDLGTLSDGEHDLKGGETHSFRVSLTSGQFLYALVEQIDKRKDDQMNAPGQIPWAGARPLWQQVASETYEHWPEHADDLERAARGVA